MSVTRERDLRTGHSLWEDSAQTGVPFKRLEQSISVEVAIIGAGISGALMAHALAGDHEVVVLDRRAPLKGSTLASTAMVQWEIDLPLTELTKAIGADKAKRAYLRSYQAVKDLTALVEDSTIRSAFRERQTLYLAGDEYGHRALATENEARLALGLPCEYLAAPDLRERFGIDRTGAILSQSSASTDPAQLAAALLRRACEAGAKIYAPYSVDHLYSDPGGVTLVGPDEVVVRAKKVVFCTGYEFPKVLSLPKADVLASWALASRPGAVLPDWLEETLVWEASDPYLYFRSTPDGRLILGGEDEDNAERHTDPALLKTKAKTLVEKLALLLPEIEFEVDYRWAGAFGESTTGLPYIAPMPDHPHVWAVAGLGGNGITYSMIASQIVSKGLKGQTDPDADLYSAA